MVKPVRRIVFSQVGLFPSGTAASHSRILDESELSRRLPEYTLHSNRHGDRIVDDRSVSRGICYDHHIISQLDPAFNRYATGKEAINWKYANSRSVLRNTRMESTDSKPMNLNNLRESRTVRHAPTNGCGCGRQGVAARAGQLCGQLANALKPMLGHKQHRRSFTPKMRGSKI